jgi:hypothetical protein
MLHCSDRARFLLDVTLGIQAKEFNLGFIRPKNLVSHGLRVFWCLLGNSKRAVTCLLLRSKASVWPLYNKGLIGGVEVVLLEGSPISPLGAHEWRISLRQRISVLEASLQTPWFKSRLFYNRP